MRRITIVLVCALIAPLAFAQTKPTTKPAKAQQTTTAQPAAATETATANTAGTIRIFQPGKTMVVDSTSGPVTFILGGSTQVVNNAGSAVTSALTPGQRVRVYYTGTGANRVAERVVTED